MGKFGGAAVLAEAADVSVKQAAVRTAHALVGTGVLAAAVGLALRVRARPGRVAEPTPGAPAPELAAAGGVR
jgi:hypothetical protein